MSKVIKIQGSRDTQQLQLIICINENKDFLFTYISVETCYAQRKANI